MDARPTLLLTADTVGGVWTYACELARALGTMGMQVHLATLGTPLAPPQREQAADLPGTTLHESRFALEWMPDPWHDVDQAGQWLLQLERDLQPDVVHLNQYAFGALPFRAPKLLVAHSCVLSWWQAVHGCQAPRAWDTYRARVAAGLAGADLVAAPTLWMLLALRAHYGYEGPGVALPNGRDPGTFRPAAKQPAVFAAGRLWDAAKNLQALDAVAARLPWTVRVAGSCTSPDGRAVQPAHVYPLGVLDAAGVARELATASIYAFPARYEPFGLSILEAALAGCTLVLGDIPSLRELWEDAAVFVPPDDHDALLRQLQHLIRRPDRRTRWAHAARARALQFSPDRMAAAVLQAYAALAPALQAAPQEELQCA